jgi:hypothetical protein
MPDMAANHRRYGNNPQHNRCPDKRTVEQEPTQNGNTALELELGRNKAHF